MDLLIIKQCYLKIDRAATFLHNWVHFCSFFAFWASLDLCNALCSKLVSFVWEMGGGVWGTDGLRDNFSKNSPSLTPWVMQLSVLLPR